MRVRNLMRVITFNEYEWKILFENDTLCSDFVYGYSDETYS